MSSKRSLPRVHVVHGEGGSELVVRLSKRSTVWVVGEAELEVELRGRVLDAGWRAPDARVRQALQAMQAAPDKRWTVRELARLVGASRATFAKVFKASTGESPMAFLMRHRLELASSRLATSDASLAEVAAECGYASEFALSRAFKRRYGVAPGQFRRSLRASPHTTATMRPLCMAA